MSLSKLTDGGDDWHVVDKEHTENEEAKER